MSLRSYIERYKKYGKGKYITDTALKLAGSK